MPAYCGFHDCIDMEVGTVGSELTVCLDSVADLPLSCVVLRHFDLKTGL